MLIFTQSNGGTWGGGDLLSGVDEGPLWSCPKNNVMEAGQQRGRTITSKCLQRKGLPWCLMLCPLLGLHEAQYPDPFISLILSSSTVPELLFVLFWRQGFSMQP